MAIVAVTFMRACYSYELRDLLFPPLAFFCEVVKCDILAGERILGGVCRPLLRNRSALPLLSSLFWAGLMTLLLMFLALSCLPYEEPAAVLSLNAVVAEVIIKAWLFAIALLLKPGVLLIFGTIKVSCSCTGVFVVDWTIGVIRKRFLPIPDFEPISLFDPPRALIELDEFCYF